MTRLTDGTRGRRGPQLRAAEFFAGIGLVRAALEENGVGVVFANDIEPTKHRLYAANFGEADFAVGDIRSIVGDDLPDIDLATASFPCTDLSLAGNRAGLAGEESSMFWEFARVLDELRCRRPPVVMLENVPSFATSHGGEDMRGAIEHLNELGYACDLLVLDARLFVPQSRPRLFIVGSQEPLKHASDWTPSAIRPEWIGRFIARHPELATHAVTLSDPEPAAASLASVVERLHRDDARWWDAERVASFVATLSEIQEERLRRMREGDRLSWATAYRRTRRGRAVWEIRADDISGCLRTARGGSSRQALVEAGRGNLRVRWMTPREYARLQGAGEFQLDDVSDNQALFGFGDAVCVPVVSWLVANYIRPLLLGELAPTNQLKLTAHG